jgi:transcriptional regulator with XRE-family HTH domain
MMSHPQFARYDDSTGWRTAQDTMRNKIKALRLRRGYRQHQVAAAIGMSRVRYCRLETGITFITAADIEAIARFHGHHWFKDVPT